MKKKTTHNRHSAASVFASESEAAGTSEREDELLKED